MLKAGRGRIEWCYRDRVSAAVLLANMARKLGVDNFWNYNFPTMVVNLNCIDIKK